MERECYWCGTKHQIENEDDTPWCSFKCFAEFHQLSEAEISELKAEGFGDD